MSSQVLTILAGGLAATVLGLVDDWRGVGPVVKLIAEASIGVALWMAGVRAGLFGIEALDLILTVIWVVAVTNAMNLLDNMDGIAAGVAAVCAAGLFAIAATRGDYLVAALAAGVAGGSLGFLRYNFPRARIFLGDAGSLLLGFLLAALGLKLDLIGQSGAVRASIPVLIVAVPLFDMMLVIAARLHDGRPISRGGTDHTAHRLVVRGLEPRRVAIVAYLVQLDFGQAVEELEAEGRIRVAAGGQKRPQKRDAGTAPVHRDHQDVDGSPAKKPVCAVDGEPPGSPFKAQQRHHDTGGQPAIEMDILEKPVEAPLHRGECGMGFGMGRQPPQADRALAHDEDHEPGERFAS